MDQSDIYRLLLIVLLIANSQLANQDDNIGDDFSYTKINELLIIIMAFSLFSNGNEPKNNTTF